MWDSVKNYSVYTLSGHGKRGENYRWRAVSLRAAGERGQRGEGEWLWGDGGEGEWLWEGADCAKDQDHVIIFPERSGELHFTCQ